MHPSRRKGLVSFIIIINAASDPTWLIKSIDDFALWLHDTMHMIAWSRRRKQYRLRNRICFLAIFGRGKKILLHVACRVWKPAISISERSHRARNAKLGLVPAPCASKPWKPRSAWRRTWIQTFLSTIHIAAMGGKDNVVRALVLICLSEDSSKSDLALKNHHKWLSVHSLLPFTQ